MAPSTWSVRSLADLAEYHNGRAFKPTEWSRRGLPIIRIAQLTDPTAIPNYFDGGDLDPRHRAEDGDLLFSWSATLVVVRWNRGPAAVNQHIFKVVERPGVDRSFLQHLLTKSIESLAEESHGSTMKHIRKGVLDTFAVPIPPLPEQRKIAAILSSVDETIEKTEAVIERLDVVKKAMLEELLTRGMPGRHSRFKETEIGVVPEEWEVARLGSLTHILSGFPFKSDLFRDAKSDGMPLIRIRDLKNDQTTVRYTGDFDRDYIMHPGSILVGMDGDFTVCAWTGEPALLNQRVCSIASTAKQKLCDQFLLFLLVPLLAKIHSSTGATTVKHLSVRDIASAMVALPPKAEQELIGAALSSLEYRISMERRLALEGSILKKALADRLLSGEVRVSP
jgi:type I restriction enzyme S subunit